MPFDPSTTKPEIDFPEGDAPTELVVEDITVGDGAEVTPGSPIQAHYVGVAHSTGEEFDASWNRGAPLAFTAGVGQVIQGWDKGLVGQKVGSRVLLVIPAEEGYGEEGSPPDIQGGDTLVFVVDILAAY